MRKVRKASGALLGGVTGAAVAVVARAFGLELPPELAAAIALLLATAGTWLAPANQP